MADSNSPYIYPKELKQGDEGHWVMFTSYPSEFGGGTAIKEEFQAILPMSAQSMISTAEAIYAEQEGLGTVLTETAKTAAAALTPYFKGGKEGTDMTKALATAADAATGASAAESVAEHGISQMIRKNDFLKRAVGGLNVAVNPKMSLLYQGPGKFRKFTFEFPMIAKNEDESKIISGMIKAFRGSTLPGYAAEHISSDTQSPTGDTRKKGAGSNFFTFPNKFKIEFGHSNQSGASLGGNGTPFKIATCVCNACVVNYAAAGVPFFFESGAPFEIKMTLTFTETIIITKEMVEAGF